MNSLFEAIRRIVGAGRDAVPPPPPPPSEPEAPEPTSHRGRNTLIGLVGVATAAILVPLVATWEGKENTAYRDVVGVWTICYGDTSDVQPGRVASNQECQERLERQLIAHTAPVLRCVPSLEGHPNQLAAASSLAYNIGTGAFCRSTVARRFNQGRWREACDAFLMWRRAGGRVVQGLVNRRNAEREICLRGLSDD